ncbi:MAG TPA: aldo/keto reductase [Fimbriimonas sp.]|nr:aldo/keto reductase [Fimbriimonas sp.]
MISTTLGRTGLTVSRAGLGGGGHSRLGLSRGGTTTEAADLVRLALDLGVNYFDTAESYGTEEAIGIGIQGVPRESVVISTKLSVTEEGELALPLPFRKRIEGCLRRLGTDYLDVLSLHGITLEEYEYARVALLPTLLEMKREGKIHNLGLTEQFIHDTGHSVLQTALHDDDWDVMMVGFNMLNQSARERVFARTHPRGIAVQLMFAVRKALSQPDALHLLISFLEMKGHDFGPDFDREDPLGWLVHDGYAATIAEAAYRYCAHEPGVDVVLFGTGSAVHLRENVKSICMPPLADVALAKINRMFAGVDSVSGN